MMLSRVGLRGSPHRRPGLQVSGGQQAPRGSRAGAPYRGPLLLYMQMCNCAMCKCLNLISNFLMGGWHPITSQNACKKGAYTLRRGSNAVRSDGELKRLNPQF